mmetsp:Transcript_5598/g.11666  ORF Transcript_5598/g.11666 Transcript_5598/m.11666 type:complete len:325 (-) Transcript_5598:330-1304(-)
MPVSPTRDASAGDAQKAARDGLKSLDAKRKALESEASAIVDELMAAPEGGGNPMGVDTPLTDNDGFPRNDIDVYRARVLRKRLNEIRTDHKGLMQQIETGLVKVAAFSKQKAQNGDEEREARLAPKPKPKFDPETGKWVVKNWDGSVAGVEGGDSRDFNNLESRPHSHNRGAQVPPVETTEATTPEEEDTEEEELDEEEASHEEEEDAPLVPFAMIDAVAPRSPASAAGLQEGDLVIQFGTATHANHCELRLIAELVPQAAGNREEIPITVLRRKVIKRENEAAHRVEAGAREMVTLNVLPGPWGGRGLLGCHIKGYTETTNQD